MNSTSAIPISEEEELMKMKPSCTTPQTHLFDIVHQETKITSMKDPSSISHNIEKPELISLSLGTSSSGSNREKRSMGHDKKKQEEQIEGLSLGLNYKFNDIHDSPENISRSSSPENEATAEQWPQNKSWKSSKTAEDEVVQQANIKRARVSVRARCGDPTIYDGCQWRKYGQKIAKGNPCPRAYYRCTVAPGCPVRKQVQRCAEDTSILISTYEGTHNHPLPASATAIASTTSAAARMLMSGSSTSHRSPFASADLHHGGLNMMHSAPLRQFYHSPSSSISSSSHPTITLDLTAPSSSSFTITQNSSYPSTSFSLGSSSSGFMNYTSGQANLSFGGQLQDSLYKNYMQSSAIKNIAPHAAPAAYADTLAKGNPMGLSTQASLTHTIAKAITLDPSFQSALAAAITSYVGGQRGEAPVGSATSEHESQQGDSKEHKK